ncbi:MAG: zinc ABC transporter substrate-binding protein [Actinomycetia bacterium]|nr:zinc ABC transporter substrate-binding protein [Actinomycetes bacterium]
MLFPSYRRFVAALMALGLAATGCSSGSDNNTGAGSPVVVVTTSIWADIVRNITCDGIVEVETLLPAGADPHGFEPSLSDRSHLESAALVVANGLGLEAALSDLIEVAEDRGTTVVRIGELVAPGADPNPHVWFDPVRVADALPEAASLIAAAANLEYADLESCVVSYIDELTALDADITHQLATIPAPRRLLITNHDSLPWFANRYGFEIAGSVIPAATTLAQANPARLAALADRMQADAIPAIFTEEGEAAPDAQALADRVGDIVVVALYTEALGPHESTADTYIGLLRTNAGRIADALA